MRWLCVPAVLLAGLSAFAQNRAPVNPEHPRLGIHWARGAKPSGARRGSPDMTWHNGPIMPGVTAKSIFWGTSWGSYTGDIITGLDKWYVGFNQSNYAATTNEYTGTNGQVTSALNYLGFAVDTTAASGGQRTTPILNEVCKVIGNSAPSDGSGYYSVYTDLPRGSAGYCAWHSWGSCGGVNVQFAFFWKLDGDPGCDPQSSVKNESQGLAALANVSGHELSEARSDPRGTGWFDSSGAENGDKCAWTFNSPYVTFSNGTQWKIQGEWSNNAYNTGTGYPNSSGQRGCLQGQ